MKPQPEMRYKYPLLASFIAIYGAKADQAKAEFCKIEHVHPSTVRKHCRILMGEYREIKDCKLHKYARFLGMPLQALKSDYQTFLSNQNNRL